VSVKRCIYEIKLLRSFQHPNVIPLDSVWSCADAGSFDFVWLVMPLMEGNLYQLLQSDHTITKDHVILFLYQILCGVKYIHSANVFHRDLKPQNILLNYSKGTAKICDFGTGKFHSEDLVATQIKEVSTFSYRAPEAILSKEYYNHAVDLWAVGCILAELLIHSKTPFFVGGSHVELLQHIVNTIGSPSRHSVECIQCRRSSHKAKSLLTELVAKSITPTLRSRLSNSPSRKGTLLTEQLLQFDPKLRPTATQALAHPFLKTLHDASDEPSCPPDLLLPTEVEAMTKAPFSTMKGHLWQMCQHACGS